MRNTLNFHFQKYYILYNFIKIFLYAHMYNIYCKEGFQNKKKIKK